MKMCKEDGTNIVASEFPAVKAGDTVKVSARDINIDGYYLVCKGDWSDGLYLQCLEDGLIGNSYSLWGSLSPHQVTKVNICFKECE